MVPGASWRALRAVFWARFRGMGGLQSALFFCSEVDCLRAFLERRPAGSMRLAQAGRGER